MYIHMAQVNWLDHTYVDYGPYYMQTMSIYMYMLIEVVSIDPGPASLHASWLIYLYYAKLIQSRVDESG